ncbi:MAG: hypothetical protein K2O58_05440 [Bacteroidales bacterium]|nr:hypothetical protein [Bacteroidales bacterium]
MEQRAIVRRWSSAPFRLLPAALKLAISFSNPPITIPESWNIDSSWQRMPLSKKSRTGERK